MYLRRASWMMALLAVWLFTVQAFADGKVFPATAYPAEVKIPDQSALLIWSNGVERLVIETRFVGEGTNFAWVVPLPSVPEIEPATTGFFPTLRACMQPEVRHSIPKLWAMVLAAGGLIWLLATVREDEPRSGADMVGCLATAAGAAGLLGDGPGALLGGLIVCLLLLFAVERVRSGRERVIAILLVLLFASIFASMLLPALGKGGSPTTRLEGVDVLQRSVVGVFDTAVLSAKDPKALLRWLNENGFAADQRSEPVIEQHVKDGWVFVTAKVNRDKADGAATPHPLSFTFKSASPVYPLRLTGVGSEQLDLELFVVGMQRAEIPGFQVTECRLIEKTTDSHPFHTKPGGKFGHALFNAWVGDLPVITKLEARLKPPDMTRDAVVSWRAFVPFRARVYSSHGAVLVAANWTVVPAVALVLTLGLLVRWGKSSRSAAWKLAAAGMVICGAAGAGIYHSLPKVEVRLERFAALRSQNNLKHLGSFAQSFMPTNSLPTLQSVRTATERAQKEFVFENLLQGGSIHEEDSPGNYTLRESTSGIDLLGYSPSGVATAHFTFTPSADTNAGASHP